jgi:hypothetical protein
VRLAATRQRGHYVRQGLIEVTGPSPWIGVGGNETSRKIRLILQWQLGIARNSSPTAGVRHTAKSDSVTYFTSMAESSGRCAVLEMSHRLKPQTTKRQLETDALSIKVDRIP